MLKFHWNYTFITTEQDIIDMTDLFNQVNPKYGGFDTETTGLHIIHDKPFLVQFGFLDENELEGYVWVAYVRQELGYKATQQWFSLAKNLKYLAGHNIKFDLHMVHNINIVYKYPNVTDTMFWIRYGHDALHSGKEGGPPLALKDYASRYIDRTAAHHEKLLAQERKAIAKHYNTLLKQRLGITLKQLELYTKDCTFELSDLPEELRENYNRWLSEDLPLYLRNRVTSKVESDMIRYDTLNRKNLIEYSGLDICFTLEVLYSLIPKVQARGNMWAVELENKLIYPLVEMESVGFQVNKEYLENSRVQMRQYIRERREDLKELAGQDIQIGQHATIKKILAEKYCIQLDSTGNEVLEKVLNTTQDEQLKDFLGVIMELRTLEKWYGTYILRFQKELRKNDNRIYTTINQVGTVSGRVTSDFQQFPRGGITDNTGRELFNPRRMVETSTGIVYLDYSQIELRFQAFYTILVGHPDKNLCRAYEPYLCHRANGERFDYANQEHIKQAYDGSWLHDEDGNQWEPVDVHGATTTAATGLKPEDPEFKANRYNIGKRVNFAKNYGATLNKIREMFPDKTEEEVRKIDAAYYTAFPGVKRYHDYCTGRAYNYAYTENLFGVRYYNVSGHKLKNMLIQGSAAFYLKTKIIELYEFSKKHNLKTKWQMQIHDELSWEYNPEDPPEIFFKFKEIMEDWSDAYVPIVADMEATNTTWAEKKDIEDIEELKGVLHAT